MPPFWAAGNAFAVSYTHLALHLPKPFVPSGLRIEIEAGAAVGGFRPEQGEAGQQLRQKLRGRPVGGLAVHVDEQISLFHGNEAVSYTHLAPAEKAYAWTIAQVKSILKEETYICLLYTSHLGHL